MTGIYDRLVGAIAAFGLPSLRLLLRGEIRAFWTAIDGTFLLVLVAGVASSVLSLAGCWDACWNRCRNWYGRCFSG